MKNKELEKRISEAFSHAAPDVFDRIQASVNELPAMDTDKSDDIFSDKCNSVTSYRSDTHKKGATSSTGQNRKKRLRIGGIAAALTAAAAAAAITLGVVAHNASTAVASTISIDAETSIDITINKNKRVISVIPKTEDAKEIVGDMDFSDTDLEVTINALLGAMISKGYLNEFSNSILIGVDNHDPAEAADLQNMLVDKIDTILQSDTFRGAVMGQTIEENVTLEGVAAKYGITLSKAQLMNDITKQHPHLKFYDLAGLSVNELNLLAKGTSCNNLDCKGKASEKAYVGSDKAAEAALEVAEHDESEIHGLDVMMDYDNGQFIYEVDFYCNGEKHEYDVDAVTGEVIDWERTHCN